MGARGPLAPPDPGAGRSAALEPTRDWGGWRSSAAAMPADVLSFGRPQLDPARRCVPMAAGGRGERPVPTDRVTTLSSPRRLLINRRELLSAMSQTQGKPGDPRSARQPPGVGYEGLASPPPGQPTWQRIPGFTRLPGTPRVTPLSRVSLGSPGSLGPPGSPRSAAPPWGHQAPWDPQGHPAQQRVPGVTRLPGTPLRWDPQGHPAR